jgi:hypothetical protein
MSGSPPSLVAVESHGSLCLVQPLSVAVRDWLVDHTGEESMWWAGALVVEPRYVADLLDGLYDALGTFGNGE